jgi:transcriptional regulator with XRE-family HTH domain
VLTGLGQALRWLRERQTRKQYRVADSAGITKGMLSAYETGRQRPSLETLEKLLDTLGCDLNDLHNALQIVNGRPDQLKAWRSWQAAGLLDPLSKAANPAPSAPYTPSVASSFLHERGAASRGADTYPPMPSAPTRDPYGPDPRPAENDAHRSGNRAAPGNPPTAPDRDLYRILGSGAPRLPVDAENAMGLMLDGFHNLMRFWSGSLAPAPATEPGAPAPADPKRSEEPTGDNPARKSK